MQERLATFWQVIKTYTFCSVGWSLITKSISKKVKNVSIVILNFHTFYLKRGQAERKGETERKREKEKGRGGLNQFTLYCCSFRAAN